MLHARSEFRFTIRAPYAEAAPLFGALKERVWAGEEWNPQFLHPTPAADIQGAVFVAEGHIGPTTWINTAFNLAAGHVQYVYFVAGSMVTLIDIHLTSIGTSTEVHVAYERTALSPEMNSSVRALHVHDQKMGPHWEESIHAYFAKERLG